MTDVIVLSSIADVSEDGEVMYDEQMNEDGSILRYQCNQCGKGVRRPNGTLAYDGPSLVEALKAMPESEYCGLCRVEGHDVCSLEDGTDCPCCLDTLAVMGEE